MSREGGLTSDGGARKNSMAIDNMPKTASPVRFRDLQKIMNNLGYYLARNDSAFSQWTRGAEQLTISMPDFRSDNSDEPVYDRNTVVDFLLHIASSAAVVDGGHRILAILKAEEKQGAD
jgi:hypothetical protein